VQTLSDVQAAVLYLKRDKIVHFKNPASKNQIPTINSYPVSIANLKYCNYSAPQKAFLPQISPIITD
jgi:hypothetical protein